MRNPDTDGLQTTDHGPRTSLRRFVSVVALFTLTLASTLTLAAEETRKSYDLPAGDAAATLKRFAEISGRETLFAAEVVRGVRTQPVKGSLTAQEALDALLAETGLGATQDARTGAFSIRRERPDEAKNVAGRLAEVQTATPQPGVRIKDGAVQLENFEVSATRVTGIVNQGVIPREENQAVRYQVISRAEIDRTGVTNMADLMRRVSFNQETGTTSQRTFARSAAATGNFMGNGDLVNLRGMGNGQTLIMINGRRVYGGDGDGADITRIPLAAVERIEILPASGSAIYGGSSVAGVINVVLRSGFQGTEVSTYVGASTEKGAEEYRFALFHGRNFNGGRTTLNLTLNYAHQNDLTRGERDYDARAVASPALQPTSAAFTSVILPMMLSPRGTIFTTSPLGLGVPANPTAKFAAIPVGSDGIALTPTTFNGTAGQASISTTDRVARTRLRNPSTNLAAVLNLEHAVFGDALGVYTELTWRRAEEEVVFPTANSAITLSATDPRNPFRTNVTPGFVGRQVTIFRDLVDLGDDVQTGIRETQRVVVGLKGKWTVLKGREVNWAVDGSWDRNVTNTDSWSMLGPFTAAAQAGYYNLFRDLTGASVLPEAERKKFGSQYLTTSDPRITAVNLRLNSDLADLWGGPLRFSWGAESRRETNFYNINFTEIGDYFYLPGALAPSSRLVADTSRDVMASFLEVVAPLVGPRNRLPGLRSLEVMGGMRYEKYSDFSAARPPVAAIKLGLTQDIALRVQYAEGFQPPTLSQLRAAPVTRTFPAANYIDPLRPGQVSPSYTIIAEGNRDLRPEASETWDAGIILTPRWARGMSVNLSYVRYDKHDLAQNQVIHDAILYFPDLVTRDAASPADVAAGRPGPVNTFRNKPVNVARQFTDAVDLTLRYDSPETNFGRFFVTGSGTWTKRFFNQARADLPRVSTLGIAPRSGNFVLEKKATGSVTWSRRAWSATWSGTYNDEFESSTTAPSLRNPNGNGIDGLRIPASFIMDLQFTYQIPAQKNASTRWRNWLAGTKWTIGALNFLNEEPDLWSDLIRGFYNPYVDPRQRFVYFEIKKSL